MLTFLSLFCSCKTYNIDNAQYAIGVVYEYQGGNQHNSALINYTFVANNCNCRNQYTNKEYGSKWEVPSVYSITKGNMFMVQYNPNNICSTQGFDDNSRMLFDYPVKDSSDYVKYVNQFKTNPPQ